MARKGLRQRAIAGEQVLGSMVFEFFTPGIAQVMKLAGCEYLIYDMEHAGFSIESLKTQVAHCRGLGIAPMVRVPRGEYHFLARALDVGAQGVMVPMVDSVEQARAIAEATHYPPKGRRGAAFGFPHDDYEPGDPAAKMKSADARNVSAVKRVVAAARKNKKGLGFMAADATWAKQYKKLGFNMLATGPDHSLLMAGIKNVLASVSE